MFYAIDHDIFLSSRTNGYSINSSLLYYTILYYIIL